MSLRAAFDRWAVVWWPRAASDAALVARYDELVLALRGGDMAALADIGPVAREMRRRGLWPLTRRCWAG